MKRILTIQDISCLGKCSLTIALPVISALGVEAVILPTAILSTHTMFKNFTFRDLTSEIVPITDHWFSEGIEFDAIYTGYLGTVEQIDLILEVINKFRKKDTLVFIDPVMGDNGKLYARFNDEYAKKNAELCSVADVIVPNITEASFMTGMPYKERYDEGYIRELLQELKKLGPKVVVLTGVSLKDGETGVMGYDGDYYLYQNKKHPAMYHGTGDLFSSTAVGEIVLGKSWQDAMKVAADYTAKTIEVTMQNPKKPWYGVDFEKTLKFLSNM